MKELSSCELNFQMQLLCKNKTQIGSFKADPIFSSMLL